jgi:hypothetical protein
MDGWMGEGGWGEHLAAEAAADGPVALHSQAQHTRRVPAQHRRRRRPTSAVASAGWRDGPYAEGAIPAGSDESEVPGEGEGRDVVAVALQQGRRGAGGGVPDADGGLAAGDDDAGGGGQAAHVGGVAGQFRRGPLRRGVPQPDQLVPARRRQQQRRRRRITVVAKTRY